MDYFVGFLLSSSVEAALQDTTLLKEATSDKLLMTTEHATSETKPFELPTTSTGLAAVSASNCQYF